jgi:hypothetical protein
MAVAIRSNEVRRQAGQPTSNIAAVERSGIEAGIPFSL